MNEEKKIPYKIYLEENEMPVSWYNVRADMKNKPAPLLNPATLQPLTFEEMRGIFCDELCKSRGKSGNFIKCTVRHLWYGHIAWKKNLRHLQKFITSLRETIPVEAIS